jgi:hypothetical protein
MLGMLTLFPGMAPYKILYEVQVISVTSKAGDCSSVDIYTKKEGKWQGEIISFSEARTKFLHFIALLIHLLSIIKNSMLPSRNGVVMRKIDQANQ